MLVVNYLASANAAEDTSCAVQINFPNPTKRTSLVHPKLDASLNAYFSSKWLDGVSFPCPFSRKWLEGLPYAGFRQQLGATRSCTPQNVNIHPKASSDLVDFPHQLCQALVLFDQSHLLITQIAASSSC